MFTLSAPRLNQSISHNVSVFVVQQNFFYCRPRRICQPAYEFVSRYVGKQVSQSVSQLVQQIVLSPRMFSFQNSSTLEIKWIKHT